MTSEQYVYVTRDILQLILALFCTQLGLMICFVHTITIPELNLNCRSDHTDDFKLKVNMLSCGKSFFFLQTVLKE